MRFIVQKAVKDYAKEKKRRVSRAFLMMLDAKIQQTIDWYIHSNGKLTLKP